MAVASKVELKLGGKTYTFEPEYLRYAAVEDATGIPIQTLGMQFLGITSVGIKTVARAIWGLIHDLPDAPKTVDEVGQILFREGYDMLLVELGPLFGAALRGHDEHMKEAEEAARLAALEAERLAAFPQKEGDAGAGASDPPKAD